MMSAAAVDMNQKIISTNLDMLEEQRGQMHRVVDQYVDQVIDAGIQWATSGERNQSTFLEIHKLTSKAMAFLSMKCDEMKSETEGDTSDAQLHSARTFATPHTKGKEDATGNVKTTKIFTNPNLESDQQTRYQDVYNQLQSVLAKQDELEQQLNMKLNNLREDTERLKSDVGTFNQYVETGKSLLKDYSQKLESLENTVSCLSGNVNEMHSDHQVLVDRINSHLSAKDDQAITELSAKVDQITIDMTDKVYEVNKDLSAKVDHITTDLRDKIDEVNTDLSELVCQINKRLSAKLLDVTQKLTDLSVTVVTTCAKKSDLIVDGCNAETTFASRVKEVSVVGMYDPSTFITGCQFNSDTGIFTASSAGIYLAHVSMYLYEDGHACISLIRQYTEFDENQGLQKKEAEISWTEAERKSSTASSLDIITMEEGDKLFIRKSVYSFVSCRIQFTCFRIGWWKDVSK